MLKYSVAYEFYGEVLTQQGISVWKILNFILYFMLIYKFTTAHYAHNHVALLCFQSHTKFVRKIPEYIA